MKDLRTVTHAQFKDEIGLQGVPTEHIAFTCPRCGTVQSAMSLIRAGAGTTYEAVQGQVGFSCVGRYTGAGAHKNGNPPGHGCNWTLGGIFPIYNYVVDTGTAEAPQPHPLFEPATPAEAKALMDTNAVLGYVEGKPVFKGD